LQGAAKIHVAGWIFIGCWLLALGWLLVVGHWRLAARGVGIAAGISVFCLLTLRLAEKPVPDSIPIVRERGILWAQVGLLAAVVVITGWEGLRFHRATQHSLVIPLWTPVTEWFGRLGVRYLDSAWVGGSYHALANPARYCLLPMLFLVPLTGFRYLGLGSGHRVVRVTALWCALPLLVLAYSLGAGHLTASGFAQRLTSNALQNGPFEEFLFRGAIQTRLTLLLGPAPGIVASSLGFGLWHLGLGYSLTGGHSLVNGLACTVIIQAVIGLGFGVIYNRTKNLLSSSVFHVLSNSMVGQFA